jgi:hypothetical protein
MIPTRYIIKQDKRRKSRQYKVIDLIHGVPLESYNDRADAEWKFERLNRAYSFKWRRENFKAVDGGKWYSLPTVKRAELRLVA